ncbi:glycoside hydrolase family 3 C-terminal domain-containing protein [Erwinia psidii]|uniref:glycoside hydrolase family 3 C-terminal domain-containing protein n=1 Tax=Erwinia psidii TaxID=69224 RepID=UPI0018F76343
MPILLSFHPGTMRGSALCDLIMGQTNPCGKLPVTLVRHIGQIPVYYNHLRLKTNWLTWKTFRLGKPEITGQYALLSGCRKRSTVPVWL